jgi:hypothetical protein
MLAASAWLSARGLQPLAIDESWVVEVELDAVDDAMPFDFESDIGTQLQLSIFAVEWGVRLEHAGRVSWVRVTDTPFVHGSDEHGLLATLPPLRDFGRFVRTLENHLGVRFDRSSARIRSSLPDTEPAIRRWLLSL